MKYETQTLNELTIGEEVSIGTCLEVSEHFSERAHCTENLLINTWNKLCW